MNRTKYDEAVDYLYTSVQECSKYEGYKEMTKEDEETLNVLYEMYTKAKKCDELLEELKWYRDNVKILVMPKDNDLNYSPEILIKENELNISELGMLDKLGFKKALKCYPYDLYAYDKENKK